MKIIFISHPEFLGSKSMPRYAGWLSKGMSARGHEVETWSPKAMFFNIPAPEFLKKWLGYIDQFIVFPIVLKKRAKAQSHDVLYVFTDHALGPWVPYVVKHKHMIHCHDFLAQRSALGLIPQNKTGFGGRMYQKFIRNGYTKGQNFISISKRTQQDLHSFLGDKIPKFSEVVYNALNQDFKPLDIADCRAAVSKALKSDVSQGYFLHVGGNQWYKNRPGVIKIYNSLVQNKHTNLPLLLIGAKPVTKLLEEYNASPFKDAIFFIQDAPDELVKKAYSGATSFLFPSIAEGFGWPIAEGMASGCVVTTTNDAPMSEVADTAAILIDICPLEESLQKQWADKAAAAIITVLNNPHERDLKIMQGLENVKRFDSEKTLDRIEDIYKKIKA